MIIINLTIDGVADPGHTVNRLHIQNGTVDSLIPCSQHFLTLHVLIPCYPGFPSTSLAISSQCPGSLSSIELLIVGVHEGEFPNPVRTVYSFLGNFIHLMISVPVYMGWLHTPPTQTSLLSSDPHVQQLTHCSPFRPMYSRPLTLMLKPNS